MSSPRPTPRPFGPSRINKYGLMRVAAILSGPVLLAVSALADWRQARQNHTEDPPVAVVISGESRGILERCGCQQEQSGGLSKRSTVISDLRERYKNILLLDAGNLTPPARTDRDRAEAMLGAFSVMRYDAISAGLAEECLGPAWASGVVAKHGLSIVGGSGTSLDDNMPGVLFERGGLRFMVLNLPTGQELARETLAAIWRSQRDRADVWVVFDRSRLGTNALTGVIHAPMIVVSPPKEPSQTAVLVSPPPSFHEQHLPPSPTSGSLVVVVPELYGISLSSVEVRRVQGRVVVSLAQRITIPYGSKSDPRIVSIVSRYEASHAVSIARPPGRQLDQALFKETTGCQSCHAREYDQWRRTPHSRSWQTLLDKHKSTNPDCISCHTTPVTAGLDLLGESGVGCATCHGNTTLHSLDPAKRTGLIRRPSERTCRSCHDIPNSPKFAYTSYLTKVRHN